MDLRLSFLLSAAIVFVGSHVILSHQFRRPLMGWLGQMAYTAIYSLVAFMTFGWTVFAFTKAPSGPYAWPPHALWAWIVAMVLTLLALLLVTGGIMRNPAAPSPNGAQLAATRKADGAFAVTRHPVMWGIALWALSHILLAPDQRTLFFMGALIVLALGGSAAQDHKKRQSLGEAWKAWSGRTSYFPQLSQLGQIGPAMWLVSLVLWLAISWLHMPLGGIPAGVWRWIG